MALIADKIAEVIPAYPSEGFCDDCLAEAVGIRRQQAQRITSALAITSDYQRWNDECELCGRTKLVICHAKRP